MTVFGKISAFVGSFLIGTIVFATITGSFTQSFVTRLLLLAFLIGAALFVTKKFKCGGCYWVD